MKINRHNILVTVILTVLPMLVSCRQELCYNHFPSLEIGLEWEREWERDYGMTHQATWDPEYHGIHYDNLKPEVPEWVNIVRYDEGVTADERFLSPNGGSLTISASAHPSFLLYNGDTEYIVLSDMASLLSARASSTQRSRSTLTTVRERHPDARTANPPDILYSAFIESAPPVRNHEKTLLNVKMQPLVYTYLVRYEFEHGLDHVTLARGALGGMAESVYLRDGVTSDESIIILYDCEMKPYGCEAVVHSFGVPGFPDEYYGRVVAQHPQDRTYTLNLEVMLKNGKIVEFNYDISDQLKNQPRGGVIKVSGIRVEDEEAQYTSGFEVDVSTWGDHEDIDLPVGVSDD